MKTHFTRKNFITVALVFLYLVVAFVAGLCCDGSGIMKTGNPIQAIGIALGFGSGPLGKDPLIGSTQAWLLLTCLLVYILITFAAVMYEARLCIYFNNRGFTKKYTLIYILTIVLGLGLALGIGLAAQYPYAIETMVNSLKFSAQALVVGLLLFIILGAIIGSICLLYVNFKNIDKPFRFFGTKTKKEDELAEEKRREEEAELEAQGNLASSFGDANFDGHLNGAQLNGSGASLGRGNGESSDNNDTPVLKDKERVFPGLCEIDLIAQSLVEPEWNETLELKNICILFRKYLAKEKGLYFNEKTIRAFVSGLAASRFIILEGLSGTGKSSLARYFSEFIGEDSFFEAVQATWRDRTSILGYYNDFSKVYNETEFLKRLYLGTFTTNHVNIMVLDELNISRIEYYFADFLSILEYPVDKWRLKIMQLPFDFDPPEHLTNGILQIAPNTYFIGTANKDDSTYTITDKVYDRSIVISFDDRNEEFEVEEDVAPINISYSRLQEMYLEAQNDPSLQLTKADWDAFKLITDYTYEKFDLTFGNRIKHQIELLVPVYLKCGGSKEEALDFMFARKVIFKLSGRFEDYIKGSLQGLRNLIIKTYGKDSFELTLHEIDKMIRKL